MKTLYLECNSGAAGDMIAAALLSLLPDPGAFLKRFNSLGIPGVTAEFCDSEKCGIMGKRFCVSVNGHEEGEAYDEHEHHSHDSHHHSHEHEHSHHEYDTHEHHHPHRSLFDIREIVFSLDIPEKVKNDAMAVYSIIADAESKVHGRPVDEVHFHEVGAMDAVADIVCVCLLIDAIKPERIVSSPVCVGYGSVECAHGILPVPAPATELILRNIPIYSGDTEGEMCTPTGAALLRYFSSEFCRMPYIKTEKTGVGMGKKDIKRANCIRAFFGDTDEEKDGIYILSFNVDDMSAEDIGFLCGTLFENGAADVYTSAIGMKKNRPGTLIRIMCSEDKKEDMLSLIFKHSSTLGVREIKAKRHILERNIKTVSSSLGNVRIKEAKGFGVERKKYEFDDISRIAKENDISLYDVRKIIDSENNV